MSPILPPLLQGLAVWTPEAGERTVRTMAEIQHTTCATLCKFILCLSFLIYKIRIVAVPIYRLRLFFRLNKLLYAKH